MKALQQMAQELARELLSQDIIGPGTAEHVEAQYVSRIAAALAARERAVLDDVLVYATMRGVIADQSKHVEHLAGNFVKEAREDGARAELFGFEQWARTRQAEAVKP